MSITHDAAPSMADMLDRAFRIYRANFVPLTAVAAIAGVPAMAAQALLSRWLTPSFGIATLWLLSFAQSLVLTLIIGNLASGALIAALAQAHHGQPIAIGAAYRAALRRYPVLLLASIVPLTLERVLAFLASILQTPLTTLAISGGAPGLDGAGLYILLGTLLGAPIGLALLLIYSQLFLYAPVAVLEQRGPLETLARGWALLAGGRWRGLVVVLITRLIAYLLGSLPWLLLTFALFRLADAPALLGIGSLIVGLLGTLIAMPLVRAIDTVFYYALRDRREGYDIERGLPQVAAEEAA